MRQAATSSGRGGGVSGDSPPGGGLCSDGTLTGALPLATFAGHGSSLFRAFSLGLRASAPRLLALALAAALVSACTSDSPRPIRPVDDLHDPNPSVRSQAVSETARRSDDQLIPELIELLDDDDAVVRLTAGKTLRDLTGRDSGYRAYAPAPELRLQVENWRAWRASQPTSAHSAYPAVPGVPARSAVPAMPAAPAAPRSCP